MAIPPTDVVTVTVETIVREKLYADGKAMPTLNSLRGDTFKQRCTRLLLSLVRHTFCALRRGKQPSSGMAITTGRGSQVSGSLPKAARVASTLPAESGPMEYERCQRACSWYVR